MSFLNTLFLLDPMVGHPRTVLRSPLNPLPGIVMRRRHEASWRHVCYPPPNHKVRPSTGRTQTWATQPGIIAPRAHELRTTWLKAPTIVITRPNDTRTTRGLFINACHVLTVPKSQTRWKLARRKRSKMKTWQDSDSTTVGSHP